MPLAVDPQIEHLLRRAGFGARSDEVERLGRYSVAQAVESLLDYESVPDDVDEHIGEAGYSGMTSPGGFAPGARITDSRQRWLFRMVHTNRPLQEKMTLFWSNHFATGFTKINGLVGATEGARYMAAKASEDPGGVRGQVEMLRDFALGNFQDILVNIAKDTAMLFWLDGRTNTKGQPQENFGREIMELFTRGVDHYTEPDVYAAARVFTGWNLAHPGNAADGSQHYQFAYVANQHDTGAKTFSFPIYPDGSKTIPARTASSGMQDGLDFIAGLAQSPETARYLAAKLYRFFVSEVGDVSDAFVQRVAATYLRARGEMKPVIRDVLTSPEFWDSASYFARYSWPVEFVVRAVKDIGWTGFSLGDTLTPLANMGQTLYDPPDVAGWDLGQSWFSTGAMLARMNFASALAANQKFRLASAAKPFAQSSEMVLSWALDSLAARPFDNSVRAELSDYLGATGAWTGSDAQLQQKVPGVMHLIAGSPEYQLL
jgi:uncharacterized protein (DUF1800 family)